ncbi:MAG: sel1 repeat family protein, partial [Verrucomicrobia bacterium]
MATVPLAAISFLAGTSAHASDRTDDIWRHLEDDGLSAVAAGLAEIADDDPDARFALGVLHDLGGGVDLDPARALQLLQSASNDGQRQATLYLAYKYRTGFNVDQDEGEAARWERVAMSQGESAMPLPPGWLKFDPSGSCRPGFRVATHWILDAASADEPIGMGNLAKILRGGPWVPADPQAHIYWLHRAAEAGHIDSMFLLSSYYFSGQYVAPDPERAEVLLRKVAEAGRADGQVMLARVLLENPGGAAHPSAEQLQEAVDWLEKAAAQASAQAMILLGRLHQEGRLGTPDFSTAQAWYRRAADQGSTEAWAHLGRLYETAPGRFRSDRKAAECYREAIACGSILAHVYLGGMIADGRAGSIDQEAAFEHFHEAAQAGSLPAMAQVSQCLFEGRGVRQDYAAAFAWAKRAAEAGDVWAQNRAALMLAEGLGTTRDEAAANEWLRKAAAAGYAEAMGNLGLHYAYGRGVERDIAQAIGWVGRSLAIEPSEHFRGILFELERNLTREEIPIAASVFRELAHVAGQTPGSPLAPILCDLFLESTDAADTGKPSRLRYPEATAVLLDAPVANQLGYDVLNQLLRLAHRLGEDHVRSFL